MATSLILIPKVKITRGFSYFRPISVGSFSSKIIANRLTTILPWNIDEEQFGFIEGHQIHESIALAQEVVNDLDRKVEGGNIMFKMDMWKAYDRLEWRFLLHTLRTMGFLATVQDLIFRTLNNIWYSLDICRVLSPQFTFSRCVSLGGPLSPLLFIMAQQILSANMKRKIQISKLHPIRWEEGLQQSLVYCLRMTCLFSPTGG